MKPYLTLFFGILSGSVSAQQCKWAEWETFQADYISQGRIVANQNGQQSSDAEGQSYALLLALIANDRQAFEQLLVWTEDNLAEGDLTARLPSALSPAEKRPYSADLWFAYALLEAGKKWDYGYYSNLGYLLAMRALTNEQLLTRSKQPLLTAQTLLTATDETRKVSRDYFPVQLIDYFAPLFPSPNWQALRDSNTNLATQAIESTLDSDFGRDKQEAFNTLSEHTAKHASESPLEGYLWRVMLMTQQPQFAALTPDQQEQYQHALSSLEKSAHKHYFNRLFTLFSDAWREQRYQFTAQGGLDLAWETQCQNR